jgi:hypothetical protein
MWRRAWAFTIRVGDYVIPIANGDPQWPLDGWEEGFHMMEQMRQSKKRYAERHAVAAKIGGGVSAAQGERQSVQAGGGPSEKLAAAL